MKSFQLSLNVYLGSIQPALGGKKEGIFKGQQVWKNYGADANAETDNGQTALQIAEERGHDDIVELLKPIKISPLLDFVFFLFP